MSKIHPQFINSKTWRTSLENTTPSYLPPPGMETRPKKRQVLGEDLGSPTSDSDPLVPRCSEG